MHDASANVSRLRIVLILVVGVLVAQLIVGLTVDSLAVLSDAGHVATDALGIGMSLAAIAAVTRSTGADDDRTFGWYRLEILAALANSALLIGVGAYVVVEAVRRLGDPHETATVPVLVIGAIGLAVNVGSMGLLHHGAAASLNVRGAYLEVMADALGSLAVIASALLSAVTGWRSVDAVAGAAIGVFILPRAWRLGRDALRVLVQAAPAHLQPAVVRDALAGIDGVTNVHDLHVWTLTSDMDVVTAHLGVSAGTDSAAVLGDARALLADRFSLTHATLQVEPDEDCAHPDW